MAAIDTFEHFNEVLDSKNLTFLKTLAQATTVELFAARSEDARNRIVEDYIRLVRELTEKK